MLAPSQVSAMKMSNLLLGVILGLLAVVHSTPVNTVTQIPVKAYDDVLQEAVTEGFLINPSFLSSITTESPKRNTTVQASQQPASSGSGESDIVEGSAAGETSDKPITSVFVQHVDKHHATTTTIQAPQQPSSDPEESDIIEGSASGETSYVTTTTSVSYAHSSTSTVLPRDIDIPSSDVSTTQSLQSGLSSSLMPKDSLDTPTRDYILVSQATDPSSGPGSGDHEMPNHFPTPSSSVPSSSNTETSMADVIRKQNKRILAGTEGSGSGSKMPETSKVHNSPQTVNPTPAKSKGYNTPGWIIIVAFIAGVAALVMLCVAIATRDKWNGPNQASQSETKTNSSNQQRELEMQTFLNTSPDIPKENGASAGYTVIPLDELPEEYSSC